MENKEQQIPIFFRNSIIETFKVQLGTHVEIEAIIPDSAKNTLSPDIACLSVLGIRSSSHNGSLSLGFPKDTFLAIVDKMLGEKHTEIGPSNSDASGELLNIIYASARSKVNQLGFDFQPAIPTTVVGKDMHVAIGGETTVLKMPCKSELGPFILSFGLRRNDGKG
jgi:CheY-specific phosphatase CheX